MAEETPTSEDKEATDSAEELVERVRLAGSALRDRHRVVEVRALRGDDEFGTIVRRLAESEHADDALGQLLGDADVFVTQIVFAAIAARGRGPRKWERRALRRLRRGAHGEIPIALEALAAASPRPVLATVLGYVDDSWLLVPAVTDSMQQFLEARLASEGQPEPWHLHDRIEENREAVVRLLESSSESVREALMPLLHQPPDRVTDADFFSQFGRIVEAASLPEAATVAGREVAIDALVAALGARKSVLLVGEPGVGKTTVLGEALRRTDEEWFVFQATAADVHAGQSFIGMLEGRVQQIAAQMRDRRIVWVLPNFEEALWAGQHIQSPRGLLDALLPYVEARQIVLVGETDPLAYEMLVQLRPRLVRTFDTVRLNPMTDDEALAVAAEWATGHGVAVSAETLRETLDLGSHYLPGTAAPGSLIRLLELTAERNRRVGRSTVEPQSVTETLSEATGLPLHILDPRTPLDLADVRSFFAGRVLGQPEAVDFLIERIALVKAGLTDPTRPLGVFFFVGPTGSGKTEIAKALAEFLFGSRDRIVRLDMSEFQTPESLERLLTDSAIEPQAAALVSSVRKEPFSVVLLDEFEKAHSNIWDVFLRERQFPHGDQFLFLSARDGKEIAVTFIDPDDGATAPPRPAPESREEPTLPDLVLEPVAHGATIRYLGREVDRIGEFVSRFQQNKDELLGLTSDPDFWDSRDRHVVLARIEYLDRFQAAAATAMRLLDRLRTATARERSRAPTDLVRMLAERLFVLDHARQALADDEAWDAFVSVEAVGAGSEDSRAAAERLAGAYLGWGERRGMRIRRLGAHRPGSARLAVSGLAAFRILKHEHGLHVFEAPKKDKSFARHTVNVTVVPWRPQPGDPPPDDQAEEALRTAERNRSIVRRYREHPSPLVRDNRGWRTGRLDRVLGGDFDLFS